MNPPQVWKGEGGGRRVQDGEHMYTCGGEALFLNLHFIKNDWPNKEGKIIYFKDI